MVGAQTTPAFQAYVREVFVQASGELPTPRHLNGWLTY